MFIYTLKYKFLKLFLLISVALTCLIAAGISVKATFVLNSDNAIVNSDTQINLNWTSVANSVYYTVSRDDTVLKIINVNTERDFLSYSDTDLSPETTYKYAVTAVNPDGNIIHTVNKSATTTKMNPASIETYYVDLNKKAVTLTWINNSKAVRKTSILKLDEGEGKDEIANLPNNGTSITFIDQSLEANKKATYMLVSSDGSGHTSPHSSAVAITPIEIPSITATLENKSAKISWNISTDIEKFVLERSVYLDDSWVPWQTVSSDLDKKRSYLIDTLSGDGTFRYRLCIDTDIHKGYSNISNPVTRLFSPSNLECVPVSSRRIDLKWTNPVGNDYKLRVERKEASSKNYSVLLILDSNISSYSDTNNIKLDTKYYYKITAYNSKNIYASSSEYYIYTGPPLPADSLNADILSYSKVTLNWEDDSNNELGFIIERKTNSLDFTEIAQVPANVTIYTDPTLSIENTYAYRVIPYNPYGNAKSYSKELSISTSLLREPPDSLTASEVSASEIKLSWLYEDSANYSTAIERKKSINDNWEIIATLPPGFTSYNDLSLTDNHQYFYRIKTVIKENIYSKPYPNTESGVQAHTKLIAPQGLKATWSSTNTIKLTWLNKSYGADYFIIERKVENGAFIVIDRPSSDDGNTWYDFSLKSGTNYTYRLTSVKGKYTSDYSKEVMVEGLTISAPTNLRATILSETKINLTWEDNSNDETGFKIQQKSELSNTWKQIGSVKPNTTNHVVDKLKPGILYTFRVISYKSANYLSSESEECEIFIKTLSAPSDLSSKAISSSAISLEWTDNSSGEQGFIIERKSGESKFLEIERTDSNVVKYTDNNLDAGKEYYYKVKAFNGSLYTHYTNTSISLTNFPKTFVDLSSVQWAKTAIENLAGRDIIKGKSTNPNIFAPNDKITRAEFINLVVIGLQFNKSPVGTFEDVKPEHWFYKNVIIAKNLGIVSGIGNNLFYPNELIKREDMAVILARALKISGNPLPDYDLSILGKYSDRDTISNYALISMALLHGEKIINGKSRTIIAPKDYATRAEAAVILYNTLKVTGTK